MPMRANSFLLNGGFFPPQPRHGQRVQAPNQFCHTVGTSTAFLLLYQKIRQNATKIVGFVKEMCYAEGSKRGKEVAM